jgi:NADH-quinone oxidoreductase subunit A
VNELQLFFWWFDATAKAAVAALTGATTEPKLKQSAPGGGSVFARAQFADFSFTIFWGAPMIPYHWQYLPLLMQIVVAFGMGAGMVVGSYFIGRHRNTKTKLAAYECGIVAVGDARGRFSVRFYMVAMLFILFDVEAVFMMPWAVIYRKLPALTGASRLFGFWEMVVYLGFVAVGLYYIVRKGVLDWSQDRADL